MVAGKGLKLPTLLGYHPGGAESQRRCWYHQGGRQYRTGVRRDRMDDWEDINAKDALVSLTTCKMANLIFRFTYDASRDVPTLGNERPDDKTLSLMTVRIGAIRMDEAAHEKRTRLRCA